MITIWVVFISFFSMFFIGLPFSILLIHPLREDQTLKAGVHSEGDRQNDSWVAAPFLGISVIVLVLQNLCYMGLRIGWTFFLLWLVSLFIWFWLVKYRRKRIATLFAAVPKSLFVTGISVYLIHGIGLFLVGASYYVGRAWHDQFNYTITAQFLVDYSTHSSIESLYGSPCALRALGLLSDRIGQSVFHGFLTCSTFTDAKTTFESAILLAPFLIVLAIYQLQRPLALPGKLMIIVSGIAGLLPSVAMVHLESFFSQALAMPFILIWPWFAFEAIRCPDWKRILATALILAAGTSIYTEFYLVFIGIGLLLALCNRENRSWKKTFSFCSFFFVVLLALCMNLGFIGGLVRIIGRINASNVLTGIYPWASSMEGLSRIWLGDLVTRMPFLLQHFLGFGCMILLLLAFLGFGIFSWKTRNGHPMALLILAAFPFLIKIFGGNEHNYQFYKLLLTISPLFLIGVLIVLNEFNKHTALNGLLFKRICRCSMTGVMVLICAGTMEMTLRTGMGKTLEVIGRGGAHKLQEPSTRKLQNVLSKLSGRDILIAWKDEFFDGCFMRGWLAYFARHNRVWLTNAGLGDANLHEHLSKVQNFVQFFLLAPSFAVSVVGDSAHPVWDNEPYRLWRVSGKNWAVLSEIINPNGLERTAEKQHFFWVGGDATRIKILAGRDGMVILKSTLYAGPGLPSTSTRRARLGTNHGWGKNFEFDLREGSEMTVAIPVLEGENEVTIFSLDKPSVDKLPNRDKRPLLIQIRELELQEIL